MKILLVFLLNSFYTSDISLIEFNKFIFGKTGTTKTISGNALYSEIVPFFGKAYKREKLYNEIDEVYYYKYYHEGARFNVNKNNVEDFEITSSKYYLGAPGKSIRVGDTLASLAAKYPGSYKKRDKNSMIIYFTGLKNGQREYYDSYLLIEYDAKTSKISMISFRGPCC